MCQSKECFWDYRALMCGVDEDSKLPENYVATGSVWAESRDMALIAASKELGDMTGDDEILEISVRNF